MSKKKNENAIQNETVVEIETPKKEKKKFSINSLVPTTIILTLICTVVTAANAVTNMYTKDTIKKIEEETLSNSMKEVISADRYSEATTVKTKDGNSVIYYTAEKDNKTVGYIFVCENDGYGGKVRCMTGIDVGGSITAVRILSVADETPGLGQNATKESFYSQYTGKTAGVNMSKNAPGDSENAVKSLTGATFTSNAVHKDISDSFEVFLTVKDDNTEEEIKEESEKGEEVSEEKGEGTDE